MAATNTGQLILDMSGVGGVISATIKQSLTAIQNSLNKIAKKPAAASFDIAGLRHQIIENAYVLYPIFVTNEGSVPDLDVITVGSGTKVFASVVFDGSDENVPYHVFMISDESESAGRALEKLLDLTQRMLRESWKTNFFHPKSAKRGYYGRSGTFYHYQEEQRDESE